MAKDFQLPPPNSSSFDIPIFQKVYDFYKELYLAIVKFPKSHKYTLGQEVDKRALELLELILQSGRIREDKLGFLGQADTKLETLKVLIRLAKDIQCMDNKKYLHLESYLQEIGRMLGGWIKHTKQKAL